MLVLVLMGHLQCLQVLSEVQREELALMLEQVLELKERLSKRLRLAQLWAEQHVSLTTYSPG